MRHITYSPILKKDQIRMVGRGKNIEKLLEAVHILANDGILPTRYTAHKLRGEYAGYWECHLESDWLLVYKITVETVLVARTGTHSDLFE